MPLYVTAWQDYLTVYRDMSGQSLHRRGYRSVMHRASLNEAAAAGCLLLAGWPDAAMTGKLLATVSLGATLARACSPEAAPAGLLAGSGACQEADQPDCMFASDQEP